MLPSPWEVEEIFISHSSTVLKSQFLEVQNTCRSTIEASVSILRAIKALESISVIDLDKMLRNTEV